jgi:O-antigen ligase
MTFTAERVSRLIVLASLVAAGAAHAYFMSQTVAAVPWVAALSFGVSFALARVSLPLALMPALLTAYIAPAILRVAFNVHDPHVFVWLALLAGPIVAASDWSRWHTPPAWTPLVAGWALVIALSWPVIAGREIDFSLAAARTLNTPNGLQTGPPPLAAASVTGVALAHLLAIAWFDLLWARFGADRVARAERWIFVPLALSSAVSTVAALYQRYVDPNWFRVDAFAVLGRASGLMLDGNSSGMAAAIWSAVAFVVWRRMGWPALGAAMSAVLLAGMWVSGSRTALMTAASGMTAVIVVLLRDARGWRMRLLTVSVVAAALVVFGLGLVRGDTSNPLARASKSILRTAPGGPAGVARALWERDGYGVAAGRAIAEQPWTGVGIGAFYLMSSDFYALALRAPPLVPDNAQNWWRQQVAELGVLGATPSLLLSVLVLVLVVRGRAPDDRRHAATVARFVVGGVGLASLVGLPTQHPALLLTVATVLYWLGALVDHPKITTITTATAPQRAAWVAAFVLPLAVIAGQWQSATGELRVPHRALRFGFPYAYGFTAYESDGIPWTGRHAVAVRFAQHAYFVMTVDPSYIGQPVRIRLWREGDLIMDVKSSGREPITRIIALPAGRRFLMLELDLSRVASDGRGLRITSEWVREVPPGTPEGLVVP